MGKKIIFMFSGQGSQYYQMGKELFESNPRFRYWMKYCDELLYPLIQVSINEILYQKRTKNETFDCLLYTNSALICIGFSLAKLLIDELGVKPDYLLGYSLGEITASVISGAIELKDALKLVVNIARLVEEKTKQTEMLAIIEPIEVIDELPDKFENCYVTAKNFYKGFVVCGLPEHISHLQCALNHKKKTSQKLAVRYGFHTKLINPIEHELKSLLKNMPVTSIEIPIISSTNNGSIQTINDNYFWNVLRYPVDFEKTINWTLRFGEVVFIDVGPSGTLSTIVKYILPPDSDALSFQMINQFGKDLTIFNTLKTNLLEKGQIQSRKHFN